MGTHPIFESDFGCLTDLLIFRKCRWFWAAGQSAKSAWRRSTRQRRSFLRRAFFTSCVSAARRATKDSTPSRSPFTMKTSFANRAMGRILARRATDLAAAVRDWWRRKNRVRMCRKAHRNKRLPLRKRKMDISSQRIQLRQPRPFKVFLRISKQETTVVRDAMTEFIMPKKWWPMASTGTSAVCGAPRAANRSTRRLWPNTAKRFTANRATGGNLVPKVSVLVLAPGRFRCSSKTEPNRTNNLNPQSRFYRNPDFYRSILFLSTFSTLYLNFSWILKIQF